MNNVISFTPSELVAFIGTIAGVCAGIATIVGIIVKIVMRLKAPEDEQNRRIKALEEKVEALEKINSDNDDRLGKVEEGIKSLIRGVQVLLNQSLGIKDAEAIKTASEDISKYLLNK